MSWNNTHSSLFWCLHYYYPNSKSILVCNWKDRCSPMKGRGLPWWLSGKESTRQAGNVGSISGSGGSPREGNGNPLKYSCLGNPINRGVWQVTSTGSQKSQTHLATKQQEWKAEQMCFISFFFSPQALAPEQATLQNSNFMDARQNIDFLLSFH